MIGKNNEFSYCIGRRAGYQGPHISVALQAGNENCASGLHDSSNLSNRERRKTDKVNLESTGNADEWNSEMTREFEEVNSSSWSAVDSSKVGGTIPKTRKVTSNQERKEMEDRPMLFKRTLLIENLIEFRSYDEIEDLACKYGNADKIKQMTQGNGRVKCYIIYETRCDLQKALEQEEEIKDRLGSYVTLRTVNENEVRKAFTGREPYIVNKQQKETKKINERRERLKKETIPKYFFARFKPNNRKRFIEASKWLYKKIGHHIWKKYNGGILIETEIDQSYILQHLRGDIVETGPFITIEPHKKFNTSWGEIFSWELENYSEQDLLDICPEEVISVVRPSFKKPLFFLEFNKTDLMNIRDIKIENLNIPLKSKKPQPMICKKCLNFGHTEKWCKTSHKRCRNCGDTDHANPSDECNRDANCYHCGDFHNAMSRKCPKYIQEQFLLEQMHLQKIDMREAKKLYRTNNTYASATKSSTQRNDSENESRKAISLETPITPYSDRQIHKDNITTDLDKKTNFPNTNRSAKAQTNTSPRKMTKKSTSSERGTIPDHATSNADGHVRKGQLRTSMAVAEAHIPTNLNDKAGTTTDDTANYRKDEDIPVSVTNQYTILSETSNVSEDDPEELEVERDQPNGGKTETEKKTPRTNKKKNQKPRQAKSKVETEIKCHLCKTEYKSEQCKIAHDRSSHNTQNTWTNSSRFKCEYREREHKCNKSGNRLSCLTLYQYRTKKGKNLYVDSKDIKYNDIKSFRLGISNQKNIITEEDVASLGGERIFCPKCYNCEFFTNKCMTLHIEFFHNKLPFEKGARPFDHKCLLEQHTCINIMEHVKENGERTYIDENKIEYSSIEEYRNRTTQYQKEPTRNKRLLESSPSPPYDESKKKNKQSDDLSNIFSEGTESQPVSVLRELFENQNMSTSSINLDLTSTEAEKSDHQERNEQNRNIEETRDDIFLVQTPDNTTYIDDEFRSQTIFNEKLKQDNENTLMETGNEPGPDNIEEL